MAGPAVAMREVRKPGPVSLDGKYVLLRPLGPEHADDLFAALADDDQEALQQFTGDHPVASAEEMRNLITKKLAIPDAAYFACLDRESMRAAGFACLMRVDMANRVLELGNVLYAKRLRRSRAGTEAVYLLARHAFEDLGFRRLEWKCNDRNSASRHAALRYGFTFEGVFRQHMIVKGRSRDTAWYSVLDREWPKRREIFEAWLAPENFTGDGQQIVSMSQLNGVGGS